MAKKKKRKDKSITWIVAGVMIVVAVFGWGCLASAYAGAHAPVVDDDDEVGMPRMRVGRGAAIVMAFVAILTFLYHSISEIPNLPWVIGWSLSNRFGLVLGILLVELLVIGGGLGLKSLEKKLAEPYRPRH